jgi:hypothetical protein
MNELLTRRTLQSLDRTSPEWFPTNKTQRKGENIDCFESVPFLLDRSRVPVSSGRQNMAESMYRNLLGVGIRSQRILRKKTAFWVVIAVKMNCTHAEWAKKAKSSNGNRARTAGLLQAAFKQRGLGRRGKTPRDELVRIRMVHTLPQHWSRTSCAL